GGRFGHRQLRIEGASEVDRAGMAREGDVDEDSSPRGQAGPGRGYETHGVTVGRNRARPQCGRALDREPCRLRKSPWRRYGQGIDDDPSGKTGERDGELRLGPAAGPTE